MIKIAICDDNRIINDLIKRSIEEILNENNFKAEIYLYTRGDLLLKKHIESNFDILFLDIIMPDKSGFDIAKEIRETSSETYIVFITSKQELVYDSFDYQPFYFVRKTTNSEILQELRKVLSRLLSLFENDITTTITDCTKGPVEISINSISYIMSEKHYLYIFCDNDKDYTYKTRGTMNEKQDELLSHNFIKTHNRYLVNFAFIKKLDAYSNSITLLNGISIPISKSFKENLITCYYKYLRK